MGDSVKDFTKVKLNDIHCSLLISPSYLFIKGYQAA